ncbi:MAG: hypothetical protein AAB036_11050 [Elusimicrobiota bacterium]
MPPETDNLRLEELFGADQTDREKPLTTPIEIEALKARDRERRREVFEMMSRSEVNTSSDLYRAAVILLHGAEPKDFLTSHRLSLLAAINGHRPSRWLTAASLDRFLMSIGLPQTYGTQFEYNQEERLYQLRLPMDDSSMVHFEKAFLAVPSVIERLYQLNSRSSK